MLAPKTPPPPLQRRLQSKIIRWPTRSRSPSPHHICAPAVITTTPPRRLFDSNAPLLVTSSASAASMEPRRALTPADSTHMPSPRSSASSNAPEESIVVICNSDDAPDIAVLPDDVSTVYSDDTAGSSKDIFFLTTIPDLPLAPSREYVYPDDALPEEIVSQLENLRNQNVMCDVEIEVEGEVIHAHRLILAAASPYFRAMFSYDTLEARRGRVLMNDITPRALRLIINYMYSCEITINSSNVQELIFAASILQLDRVCAACQNFMTQYLTTTNCLIIRQFAEQHNCTTLLSSSDEFAVEHFHELRKQPEFHSIPFSHLRYLIQRCDLKVNSEEEWIYFDIVKRRHHLDELLPLVRVPHLAPNFLFNTVMNEPLIKESRACMDILTDAMTTMLRDANTDACADRDATVSISMYQPTLRKNLAGVIFCVGGRGTSGDPFRTVEAYDLRRNRWFAVPEMKSQRRHVGVGSCNGNLFAIGGHDGGQHLDTAECFDPKLNKWRKVSPMLTARRGIAIGSLGSVLYAVGGLDDATCFNVVERYEVETDQWTLVSPMNVQRGGVGVASIGKYLFAVGGNDGTASLNSCERYDPFVDRWRLVSAMTNRRAGAGVCVLDNLLYAVGGFDDNSPLATVERYDPITNTWTQLAPMSCPRGGVGVAAMGGLVYAIGGHDGHSYLDSVETYDPATNSWALAASIKQCRAGAGVAWADCKVDVLLSRLIGSDSGCAPGNSGNL